MGFCTYFFWCISTLLIGLSVHFYVTGHLTGYQEFKGLKPNQSPTEVCRSLSIVLFLNKIPVWNLEFAYPQVVSTFSSFFFFFFTSEVDRLMLNYSSYTCDTQGLVVKPKKTYQKLLRYLTGELLGQDCYKQFSMVGWALVGKNLIS